MQIELLIADDHLMIRVGVGVLIESQFSLNKQHIDQAASCSELLDKLKTKPYTHLVLDLVMSDGNSLEILPTIRRLYPRLRIMIFSVMNSNIYERAAARYGAFFCPKETKEEKMHDMFLRFFFPDTVYPRSRVKSVPYANPFEGLTPRDLEILHYLVRGVGTGEISQALNVKPNTISTAKKKILEKTNTTNLIELSELASLYLGQP